MLVVGLTGSIGMGKSAMAEHLRSRGVPVCDADALVHELYAPGGAAVSAIEAAFPGTTAVDEGVNRARLSEALAQDPKGFEALERIVHPLVRSAEVTFLQDAAEAGQSLAVLEIPLLFETGGDAKVDATIVVSAPAEVQRDRVLARPDMTEDKLALILSRQVPDAEKRARADFVVDTGTTLAQSQAALDSVIADLMTRTGSALQAHWGAQPGG